MKFITIGETPVNVCQITHLEEWQFKGRTNTLVWLSNGEKVLKEDTAPDEFMRFLNGLAV